MSSTRYIEINSAYRDRKQFPNPSFFTVQCDGPTNPYTKALDPVCEAAPVLYWTSSFQATSQTNVANIRNINYLLSPSDPYTILVTTDPNTLRHEPNYYVGAVLKITISSVDYVYRITKSEWQNVTQSLFTLDQAITPLDFSSAVIVIQNPGSTFYVGSSVSKTIYLPSSYAIDNYYKNKLVQNITSTNETRLITAFNGITHLATLSSEVAWVAPFLTFAVRNERPISFGLIAPGDALNTSGGLSYDLKAVQLSSAASSDSSAYDHTFIRLAPPSSIITDVAPYNEQKQIIDYAILNGTIITHGGVGTNTFTLDAGVQADNYYTGFMITDIDTAETRTISSYSSSRSGTVIPIWGGGSAGSDAFYMRSVVLAEPFSAATPSTITPGTNVAFYEIEKITRDNMVPLAYRGSLVSIQETVCYEIKLLNLILPNTTLDSGGRAIFYPYLYVELSLEGNSSNNNAVLYSNNPHSTRMMFS